jgi:DNA polymerase III subunit gamma/tau
MVLNSTGGEAHDLSVPPRHKDTLLQQARALQLDTILAGLDILASTKARLRNSNHGRVLLEMALVRLGRLDDLVSLSQLAQAFAQGRSGAAPTAPRPATTPPPEAVKKKPLTAVETPAPAGQWKLTTENLPLIWQAILAQAGPLLSSELKRADFLAISGPNTLVISFPSRYNQGREYCQAPASVTRIEELLRKITGQACQLRIEAVSVAEAPASAPDAAVLPSRYRRQRAEAVQAPLLQRAIDVLGAQIIQVDEGFGAAPSSAVERPDSANGEEP